MGSWKRCGTTRCDLPFQHYYISDDNMSLVFRSDDGPRYVKAWISHMVMYGLQIATIFFLRVRLMHLNVMKRRAQSLKESQVSGEDSVRSSLSKSRLCVNHLLARMSILPIDKPLTTLLTRKIPTVRIYSNTGRFHKLTF